MSGQSPAYDFDTLYPRHAINAGKWQVMRQEGKRDIPADVFPFSVADMDFRTAPEILAALHEAADFGIYGYESPTESYYTAICAWQARRHGFSCQPEWIIQVPNVVYGLYQLVQTFSQPGDGVIIQTPVYPPFFYAVENQQRRLVCNPLILKNGRYEMDLDDLATKAADPGVRLMILCSPHNPVGRVWSRAEIEAVSQICLEHQVLLISDEIHADLVYAPHRHTAAAGLSPEAAQNCIICTSPSKTFNLASLSTANLIIADEMKRQAFHKNSDRLGIHGANHFGTVACQAAYESGEAWYQALLVYLTGNRDAYLAFMRQHLPQLPASPTEGTYLGWFDARALGLDNTALAQFMHRADLYFVEGTFFGQESDGWERINFALPRAMLLAGLNRLQAAVRARQIP